MKNRCMSKKLLSVVLIVTLVSSNMVYATELIKKDETVYVTLSQKGEVKERIVSDWLHSDEKNVEVQDKSILKDIKNVKGEEKPNGIGENLTWKLEGNDIYYRGTTDKKLPIDVNVKYTLNGKEIKPENLAGKSGELKMKIDYVNNDSHMVNIKGKMRKIYTPFSTVTVLDLPVDNFKNVKINSGKMINDGNNQIVTFICLPGMKESLDLKDNILDLKESLEITAQVKNFEMGPIMITGTPELPDMSEFKSASTLDDLIKGINDIKDASTKLADGTGKLVVGQKALADNMTLFNGGVSKLGIGALGLNNGVAKLGDGVNAAQSGAMQVAGGLKAFQVGTTKFGSGAQQFGVGALDFATNSKGFANGAVKVADGTDKLIIGSKALSDGANKLAEGTNTVSTKMESLSTGLDTMVESTTSLQQGQKKVIDGTEQSLKGIDKLKRGKQLEMKSTEALIVRIEKLQGLVSLLGKIPGTGEIADNFNSELENEKAGLVALKDGGNELLQGLNELEQGIVKIKAGSEQVNTGMSQLQEGQKSAASGSKELAKSTKQISDKSSELAKGAVGLAQGGEKLGPAAESLRTGSDGLTGGADKLNVAAKDLSMGTKTMAESTQKLVGGSQSVVDGLAKLNSEGVKPLMEGTTKLNSAAKELSVGSVKLKDGADKLVDGSKELDENMIKFDKEGIQKISSKVDSKMGDLQDVIDVKDELVEVSNNYGTFSGIGDEMDGKVKFVMKTDEIRVKTTKVKDEKETVKEEKIGLFGWIKNLFS
ncbi:hypothetical protein [Clostridium sp.]|uniref:hypothetical protein n=1 Tax=Clostridium sp. TaxID=1506 RepID=UPI003D6D5D8F